MVRVQAAEKGTYGRGRSHVRLYRPDDLFDLAPGDKPAPWMVVVPDDTTEPYQLKADRDPKTKRVKWSLAGKRDPVKEHVPSISEVVNSGDQANAKALRAKTAANFT